MLTATEKKQALRVLRWTKDKALVVASQFVQDLVAACVTSLRAKTPSSKLAQPEATSSPMDPATASPREMKRSICDLKLELLCPGLVVINAKPILPSHLLGNATEIEAFLVLAESGGDPVLAQWLWKQPVLSRAVHMASQQRDNVEMDVPTAMLKSFQTWWESHRTQTISVLSGLRNRTTSSRQQR